MLYHDVVAKIKKQFLKTDVSNYEGKLAIQFNLTGDEGESGWFYVEVLNGKLSIEEYTYDDRDAEITISGEDLIDIASGKLNPQLAYVAGRLKINGDVGKALQIAMFVKEGKKASSTKKSENKAASKAVTKKSPAKKPAVKKETKPAAKKETSAPASEKKVETKLSEKAVEAKPAVAVKEEKKAEVKAPAKETKAPTTTAKKTK